jgi:nucleotide-binding universal stress UspA family protein
VIERVLLAVDDTPDSLAAARLAVQLAASLRARLRVVHVQADRLLDAAVQAASGRPGAGVRREQSTAAMLLRTEELAGRSGVPVETVLAAGPIGAAVLDTARRWPADLIVVGKSTRSASGEPYVGTETRHILEFADQPVLVVPAPRHS